MIFSLTKPTALLLVTTQQGLHDSDYWRAHEYKHPVIVLSVRCCLCEICFGEMKDIADQWARDYDSMLEDMRVSSQRFLGFDIWEEWKRKTT